MSASLARSTALPIALLLTGLLLAAPASAAARGQVHPAIFALSPDAFPPGSSVVRAGVESNLRLRSDQSLHFGLPAAALGRITGYYMDAVEGSPASALRPYTSYLVSIFRSVRQAQTAFSLRWDTWFAANYYTTPSLPPVALGDRGAVALFHTLDPGQPPLSELMFRRGAILVEVFQGTVSAGPTTEQLHAFFAIAAKLDELAGQHRSGV